MSTKATQVAKSVLSKIVSGFADSFRAATNQTNLVTQVCDIINQDYTDSVPAAHITEITDALADEMGWTGRTRDSRKSEARAVLRSHHVLGAMCNAVTADKRCDSFTWHNAIKVARIWVRQNKKGKPTAKAVVAEYFKKSPAAKADPLDKLVNGIFSLAETSKAQVVKDLVAVLEKAGYVYE